MKEQVLRFIGAVFLTILALLGLGAGLHVLMTLPFDGKGPEWVGAIGTVAALAWAIWLATAETRHRQQAERVMANLHGAGMLNRIELARNSVHTLVKFLPITDDVDSIDLNYYQGRLDSLNSLELWQVADLVPLVPLPHNTATKLAQAADQLHAIKRLLKMGQDERATASKADRIRTKNAILARASVVQLQLRDAENECRKSIVTVSSAAPT